MTQHIEQTETKSHDDLLHTNDPSLKKIVEFLNDYKEKNNWDKVYQAQKSIDDCWDYIVSVARSKAKDGCCCMLDEDVFNLAIHYYDEDGRPKGYKVSSKPKQTKSSDANLKAIDEYNEETKKKLTIDEVNKMMQTRVKKRKEEDNDDQISLF